MMKDLYIKNKRILLFDLYQVKNIRKVINLDFGTQGNMF